MIGMSHPKHVYMYKNMIKQLKINNNVLVLINDKEIVSELLDSFEIRYKIIGYNKNNISKKILQLFKLMFITLIYSIKFRADLFVGVALPHFTLASLLFRKPFIMLEDTESAKGLYRFVVPFTSAVITSENFNDDFKHKHIKVQANLECLYLHPVVFKPEKNVLEYLNLKQGEKFIFLRFVSWKAFHDKGQRGLSNSAKERAVLEFSKFGKVFISSEDTLDNKLKKYELNIPIHLIHSLEYYADLVFGESPTITTESAMLGTPSICISSWAGNNLANFQDLHEHNLSYSFKPEEEGKAIDLAIELLATHSKDEFRDKANKYMNKQINLSAFMIWLIENYPGSHKVMGENPSYQERFK